MVTCFSSFTVDMEYEVTEGKKKRSTFSCSAGYFYVKTSEYNGRYKFLRVVAYVTEKSFDKSQSTAEENRSAEENEINAENEKFPQMQLNFPKCDLSIISRYWSCFPSLIED